jgi:hypothetical protein
MGGFSPERISMTMSSSDQQSLARPLGSEALGTILLDWRKEQPDRPLLLLKKGLRISPSLEQALFRLLQEFESGVSGPVVLTLLSNAEPRLNPWAGLETSTAESADPEDLQNLIAALAPGQMHEWVRWPDHCLLLSAAAVAALAQRDTTRHNALSRLRHSDGQLLLPDGLYLAAQCRANDQPGVGGRSAAHERSCFRDPPRDAQLGWGCRPLDRIVCRSGPREQ